MVIIRVELDVPGLQKQIQQIERDIAGIGSGQATAALSSGFDTATRSATTTALSVANLGQQTRLLLTDTRGLSNIPIALQGAPQVAGLLANLSSSADVLTTAAEPLADIAVDAVDQGAKQTLDDLVASSLEALKAAEPLEEIVVYAVGGVESAQEILEVADAAFNATDNVTGLTTSFGALSTVGRLAALVVGGVGAAVGAAVTGLAAAAFASGDLEFGLSQVGISLGDLGTALGRVGQGLIRYVADVSEAVGLTSLLNQGLDLLSDGVDFAADNLNDFADVLLDIPPTAEELAAAIEESAENLARLEAETQRATGAAGAFQTVFGDNTAATAAYNDALEEHQALLAEQARQATLSAIANQELGDSVGFTAIAFQSAASGLTGFRAEAAEAARVAALAALANQDLSDSVDAAGINYKTLTDNTREAALATERAEAAARAAAEAERAQAEGLRQLNEDLRTQIELFDQVEAARRQAFDDAFDDQVELFERIRQVNEEALGGIADTIAQVFGTSGGVINEFFDNFEQLLIKLGFDAQDVFAGIANTIAEAFGLSIQELDGFFGLAVEGLDFLGIEFEDVFGNKLTGLIERFASLSRNEVSVLGDIFTNVAGVIGGVFNPQVQNSTTAFNALGIAGNDSLGGLSVQIEGLISDVFGLNEGLQATTASTPALGASLGAVFAVGSIGFQDLQNQIGTTQAALLGGLNPSILTTNGLFKLLGIDAVGAIQSVIGSLSEVGNAVVNFGGIFSGVIGQASSVFKLFSGDIQGAFLQALGPIGSALDAFGVDFNSVISGAGNLFRNVFQGIQSAGTTVFNALASAGRALGGALQSVASGILGAFTSAFNAIRNVATSAFNFIAGAGRQLLGALSGVFSGIAGAAAGAFNSLVGVASGAFGSIVGAARGAAGQIGSTFGGAIGKIRSAIGGIGGGIGGGIRSVGRSVGRAIRSISPFAKGGVINGPTSLDGEGLGGRQFRTGTVLNGPTNFSAGSATQTQSLGLAGEAGPEAILPLTKTSQGLGVSATGVGGGGKTKIFIIQGVDRQLTERLESNFRRLDASVEFRAGLAAERLLLGQF